MCDVIGLCVVVCKFYGTKSVIAYQARRLSSNTHKGAAVEITHIHTHVCVSVFVCVCL